jgi:predicted RNA-binding Zn ribbon-like protein
LSIDHITLVGGHVCLDFMNTVGNHLTDTPGEWLTTYADFIVWAEKAGVITGGESAALMQLAEQQPAAAEQVSLTAIDLRETIFRLLLCAIRQQAPSDADLAAFNQALAQRPQRTQVIYDGSHYQWQAPNAPLSLDSALWRLLWSAADLLTSDQLAQAKICEGDGCGWVFLDTSRNHARRWCSMADCGNRSKANRYYKRHKTDGIG